MATSIEQSHCCVIVNIELAVRGLHSISAAALQLLIVKKERLYSGNEQCQPFLFAGVEIGSGYHWSNDLFYHPWRGFVTGQLGASRACREIILTIFVIFASNLTAPLLH